ncbi:hypothetical protein PAI11_13100 [Patulibacter medicamentivorans]|uniref:YtkA-like domain-containing protein n=1 Tax=Patulibacter medicamentivorans TaxID=1097667 RepID=H0E3E2_9ACTN|nr:hypothetical protein [Patulibacter medicamentivorans]EHN11794.1 hypothetical protein PAI11_13100 [Patulibacter medicamentivorans]
MRTILSLVAAATLALPAAAAAHGGALLGAAEAGPYRLRVMAAAVREPGRPAALDVTTYVQDRVSGRPIEDARVSVVVEVDGAARRHGGERIGNGYEAVVAVPDATDPARYAVRVAVRGREGAAALRIAAAPRARAPTAAIAVSALLAILALAWVWRRRRARAG